MRLCVLNRFCAEIKEEAVMDRHPSRRAAICTLGCKVNQYETQAMEGLLAQRGYELVPFEGEADVYIINTCTVTAVSDKKSRQMIRQARRRNSRAVVAVCGCYAQTKPEDMERLGVDIISGTGDRLAFLEEIEKAAARHTAGEKPALLVGDIRTCRDFEALPAGGLQTRTRAMLKVEDGCTNYCSYCIIPYARGPVRSLPLKQAVAEVRRLQEEGYREIVLTGIEISSWGRELKEETGLIDLIEGVSAAAPGLRLRLGSLEPRTVTEGFCSRLSALPNVCPHFHLSLQSGCDATLRRMRRRYDTARYLESCQMLRKYLTAPAITTDLITGFPGETEEEFSQTLDFIRVCGFSSMHIFPYSRREGTAAANYPGQVEKAVKEQRAAQAREVARQMEGEYLSAQLGRTLKVLFEERTADGLWRGHGENYAEVLVESAELLRGQLRPALICGVNENRLFGQLK